jgi:hypothetical protein
MHREIFPKNEVVLTPVLGERLASELVQKVFRHVGEPVQSRDDIPRVRRPKLFEEFFLSDHEWPFFQVVSAEAPLPGNDIPGTTR